MLDYFGIIWLLLREFLLRWEVILPGIVIGIVIYPIIYFHLQNKQKPTKRLGSTLKGSQEPKEKSGR
jgi:hypothetical protein